VVLTLRNTGNKELVFYLGGNGSQYFVVPHLEGPGVVNLVWKGRYSRRAAAAPVEIKLPAGAVHELPIGLLKSGPHAAQPDSISYSYWTQPGKLKLNFTLQTRLSPAPEGSKEVDNGFGGVTLTSNTVEVEVVDAKEEGKRGVPAEVQAILAKAEQIEVLSLSPSPDKDRTRTSFHGYPVLGKTILKDEKTRKALVEELEKGVKENKGEVANCFLPRHGIRAVVDDKPVDLLICFQCLQVKYHIGEKAGEFLVTRSPEPAFDKVLKDAGVRLAPKE
jgi:hypothetical protein